MGTHIEFMGDGKYRNPFEDKEYNVSLKELLVASYKSMLNPALDYSYSNRLLDLVKEYSSQCRKLTVKESSTLAEKELSQLERRLTTYKNLVELAVHLD
jgi:hypothetical protein